MPIIRLQNIDRNHFIDKNIKFVSEEKANELKRHSFVVGDIAITKLGDPLGKAVIIPNTYKHGIIVADIVRVRLEPRYTNNKFVTYAINSPSVIKSLEIEAKGTTRPRVNLEHIRRLQIPFAPLNEQKRVADKLDNLLTRVDSCQSHLERVTHILKRFQQSVLTAATAGHLTEKWRKERNEEKNWQLRRIGDITSKVGSGATPKGGEKSYKTSGIPLIRSMNVIFYGFKREGLVYLDQEQANELRNVEVKAKDVLLNITGASIGRVTLAPPNLKGARVNQHVCIIRPTKVLLPEFLSIFLSAPEMQQIIGAENYGVTRQALTKEQILDFDVPVPSIDEQKEIVRRVKKLFTYANKLNDRYQATHSKVERLTPSLLSKAFRGELVPQDPNDEPAEVLLERIMEIRKAEEIQRKAEPRKKKEKKVSSKSQRKPLYETLLKAGVRLSPEDLFRNAGFDKDSVDEFYEELRAEIKRKRIKEIRSGSKDVYLKGL